MHGEGDRVAPPLNHIPLSCGYPVEVEVGEGLPYLVHRLGTHPRRLPLHKIERKPRLLAKAILGDTLVSYIRS